MISIVGGALCSALVSLDHYVFEIVKDFTVKRCKSHSEAPEKLLGTWFYRRGSRMSWAGNLVE